MKFKFKKLLASISLVFVMAVVVAAAIRFLPEEQKWLFISRPIAERYAIALLSGDVKQQEKLKNEFIDYVVAADPHAKTVLFSSHENHDIAFLYAPSHSEQSLDYQSVKASKIANGWYCLK